MGILTIGVENALNVTIERSRDADAREHRGSAMCRDQDQRLHRGLPFRGLMVCFRQLRDEAKSALEILILAIPLFSGE